MNADSLSMNPAGGALESIETLLPALHKALARYEVTLAYLYGSQARGNAGPLSDVDLAVLFRSDLASPERFQQLLAVTGEAMDIFQREDVFVADLADATPLLRFQVYQEGRLLYCRDDAIRVKFMMEALRDYEDTRPLREIQHKYLLQRIANGTFSRQRAMMAEKRAKYGAK